jgi:hypothetical protein
MTKNYRKLLRRDTSTKTVHRRGQKTSGLKSKPYTTANT